MKIFSRIYQKTLKLASHDQAPFYLGLVSFIEAVLFPIPPDVMLMPMSISKPKLALRFAVIASIWSTIGGMAGYGIGYFASDWATHMVIQFGYANTWHQILQWFETWGVLIVFVAGFSPIPYKIITICTGVSQLAFVPFVIVALVSRFLRFYLVARLSAWGGVKFADKINRFIEWIGWGVVVLAVLIIAVVKLRQL